MDHAEGLNSINNFLLGGKVAKKDDEKTTLPTEDPNQKQIIVKRYMLEVTTYPDGREFVRSWVVSKGPKTTKKKEKPVRKPLKKVKIVKEEVY